MNFFSFYHFISRRLPAIPKDESQWPQAWKEVVYKAYAHAPLHTLSGVQKEEFLWKQRDIDRILSSRRTQRVFPEREIPEHMISMLLAYACGEVGTETDGRPRRVYPSGGALYPIEIYIQLKNKCEHLAPGMYHYRPDLHALEALSTPSVQGTDSLFAYEWAHKAPITIFLTCAFSRTVGKYGERAYRYALLEAGHISQNFSLVGEALGLQTVEMGASHDEKIESLLAIDGSSEVLVHSMVIG